METAVLLGQTLLVTLITSWLVIGTIENIRYPSLNGNLVGQVLSIACNGRNHAGDLRQAQGQCPY